MVSGKNKKSPAGADFKTTVVYVFRATYWEYAVYVVQFAGSPKNSDQPSSARRRLVVGSPSMFPVGQKFR